MKRDQFVGIDEMIKGIEAQAGNADPQTREAIRQCSLTAQHMAWESSEERFARVGECAWNAIECMLEYVKLKTYKKPEVEEIFEEIEYVLFMMDACTAGPVLSW